MLVTLRVLRVPEINTSSLYYTCLLVVGLCHSHSTWCVGSGFHCSKHSLYNSRQCLYSHIIPHSQRSCYNWGSRCQCSWSTTASKQTGSKSKTTVLGWRGKYTDFSSISLFIIKTQRSCYLNKVRHEQGFTEWFIKWINIFPWLAISLFYSVHRHWCVN